MTTDKVCARCGRSIPDSDAYGMFYDLWFCHPDDEALDDCYHLMTIGAPFMRGGFVEKIVLWLGGDTSHVGIRGPRTPFSDEQTPKTTTGTPDTQKGTQ